MHTIAHELSRLWNNDVTLVVLLVVVVSLLIGVAAGLVLVLMGLALYVWHYD